MTKEMKGSLHLTLKQRKSSQIVTQTNQKADSSSADPDNLQAFTQYLDNLETLSEKASIQLGENTHNKSLSIQERKARQVTSPHKVTQHLVAPTSNEK